MMVPLTNLSHYDSLLGVLDQVTDVVHLRSVVRKLVRDNKLLDRFAGRAIKSVENQNSLIDHLQKTLSTMIAQNKARSNELCEMIGRELLSKLEDVARCQVLITKMIHDYEFEELDKEGLEDLQDIALTVSYLEIRKVRDKCIHFLEKQRRKADIIDEAKRKRLQKDRIIHEFVDPFKYMNGAQYLEIGEKAKKKREKLRDRNETRPQRKNSKHRRTTTSDLKPSSELENSKLKKSRGRRRHKRKAGEVDEYDLNNSIRNTKSPVSGSVAISAPVKKMRGSSKDSIRCIIPDSCELKPVVVKLTDFMIDPTAESDDLVARFKQANNCKNTNEILNEDNEKNEVEVDKGVDSSVADEKASDANSGEEKGDKNLPDDSVKEKCQEAPPLSEYNEATDNEATDSDNSNDSHQDHNASSAQTSICDAAKTPPRNPVSNGKKGPRTPSPPSSPPSSPPYCNEIFRRGPRTPPGWPDSEVEASDGDDNPN